MGREIKFRKWCDRTSVMIDGDSLAFEEYAPLAHLLTQEGIMQYTGLKDRNGKEIYEGDIHKLGDEVGAVEYHDGTYFVLGEYCTRFLYQDLTEQKGEVIGNIFEHKELITRDKGNASSTSYQYQGQATQKKDKRRL